MWSAFLALDISAVLFALAATQVLEEDELAEQAALASSGTEDVSTEHGDTEDSAPVKPCWYRQPRPNRAHGKRLRREIIMVPGRIAHHARRLIVHLHPSQQDGPMPTA